MDLGPNQDRCGYFEGLFSPYIAGDLDDAERRALAEHLHDCERCTQQFGLSWRRATSRISAVKPGSETKRKRRKRGSGLWILAIASLLGVSLLGAMGYLDAAESQHLDPFQRGAQRRMDEELGRMLHVQTALLQAVVEPLRGTQQTVSHAQRGLARDFVEALEALRGKAGASKQDLRRGFEELAHLLLRVSDPGPGGRSWTRAEFLESIEREGLPPVVLVDVVSAFREVLFLRMTWGKRPVYAWLLRGPDSEEAAGSFQLAFMVYG